jgi:hypothetical protein
MEEAIVISWPEDFDDPIAEEIVQLNQDYFKVKASRTEPVGLLAMLEWAIPTGFMVYLFGNFFKSFLSEAGKDTYQVAKSRLKLFIIKRRELKTRLIAASTSPNKLSKSYDQSLTISLKARIDPKLMITVLFSEQVTNEETDQMLEGMFQALMLVYEECQKQPAEGSDENYRPKDLYLIANPETKQWEILTPQQMSERYRNK